MRGILNDFSMKTQVNFYIIGDIGEKFYSRLDRTLIIFII